MECRCHKIPTVISFIAIITGILVINGWIFGITFLKSIYPDWTPMKFVSAICFVLSGLILLVIHKTVHAVGKNFSIGPIILSLLSLTIILFVSIIFASNIFEIPVGIEKVFVEGIVHKSTNLQPSSVSMVNFLIIAVIGIIMMFNLQKFGLIMKIAGFVIGLVGLVAIIGHLFNIPALYYEYADLSFAMAVFSGPLFVLIGFGFFILGRCGFSNIKQ